MLQILAYTTEWALPPSQIVSKWPVGGVSERHHELGCLVGGEDLLFWSCHIAPGLDGTRK